MENSTNSTHNQNDSPKPNPSNNSIDGFSRPSQSSPSSDAVVSSISITPSESDSSESSSSPTNNTDQEPSAPVLSAPITSGNMDQKKSKIWTIVLVVLVLVVFVGGIYGVYAYQQKKINNLNTQVTDLTAQNASLKSQLNKLKSSPTVSITTQPTSTTKTVIKIPELGASFNLPANIADLTYALNSTKTQANLSSQNLASLDPACTATATVAPLGSVVKTNGQYPTTPSTTTTLIKQYPTYYIAYVKPATNCSSVTQINNFANILITDFKNSFSTIAVIS